MKENEIVEADKKKFPKSDREKKLEASERFERSMRKWVAYMNLPENKKYLSKPFYC